VLLLVGGVVSREAWAGGPRWVTGPPYFSTTGQAVVWFTKSPQYFTDAGDLSATVNHAAADALVAAAAGEWNVPTSALVLAQGGVLAEHVSGANAYVGSTGVVFPADVQASNYLSVQIAVIYDRDGSVTDMLLGSGASDPSGCRQNGVTESVDSISTSGFIQHAVLVLNGRCTGTDPAMQLQLRYQLVRAFGRVIGLGWSQTNDNVFTGSPTPTYQQALHWPIMHPIDILCGPYTYQCLPQPFTLRDDDLAGLAQLYMIPQGQAGPGHTDTLYEANALGGQLRFPNGQGMQGVNVVGRRLLQYWNTPEGWYDASSVTGYLFRRTNATAVGGPDSSVAGSMGTEDTYLEGYYNLGRVPMLPGDWQQVVLDTEPVNPLYTGEYSVGPYTESTVVPSGSTTGYVAGILPSYSSYGWFDMVNTTGAAVCSNGGDGTESAPGAVAATGWWMGTLCGYGHTAWWGFPVKAGRTLTLEVTAEDEQGFATVLKAMPVIGVWHGTDPLGTQPGDASVTEAFNGVVNGMTRLEVQSTQAETLRVAIADERGDGRPDYNYQGRVLYADSVTPGNVGAGGGVVTIAGMGFRNGDTVTVNGVAAVVSSWSATQMVVTVPSTRSMGVQTALVADVVVTDGTSGGESVMTGALAYAAPLPEVMTLVSAPVGGVTVGTVAGTVFAVRITEADGVTPVAGEPVVFSAAGGGVRFGVCGAGSCTVATDATGMAATTVTPLVVGSVTLSAVADAGSETAVLVGVAPVRTVTMVRRTEYVAAGATVVWQPAVIVTDNSASTAGVGVVWQVTSGRMGLGSAGVGSTASTTVDGTGTAVVTATVGPLAAGGTAAGTACAWATVCAGFGVVGVDLAALQLEVVSGDGQVASVGGAGLGPVVLRVTDGSGAAVAGATVEVYQTLQPGMGCPARGRCPVAPVYAASQGVMTSDADGLVTVTPLQMAGVVEVTKIAGAVGTSGFATAILTMQ
jgi:hypothetical protein